MDTLAIAVCGAHLSGMPLNFQLIYLGAVLKEETKSSPVYRMFELANQSISKPGMIRDEFSKNSKAIIVEVWDVPIDKVGIFLADIKYPLCLGEIELDSGKYVHGFICEKDTALLGYEIIHCNGWKFYKSKG